MSARKRFRAERAQRGSAEAAEAARAHTEAERRRRRDRAQAEADLRRFEEEVQRRTLPAACFKSDALVPIGRGIYGQVFRRGHHALKVIANTHDIGVTSVLRELQAMEALVAQPDTVRCISMRRSTAREDRAVGDHIAASFTMTMPLANSTLATSMDARQPFGDQDVACVAFHLLRALAHAHAMGIVHRDIKPSNVLLFGRRTVRFSQHPQQRCTIAGCFSVEMADWGLSHSTQGILPLRLSADAAGGLQPSVSQDGSFRPGSCQTPPAQPGLGPGAGSGRRHVPKRARQDLSCSSSLNPTPPARPSGLAPASSEIQTVSYRAPELLGEASWEGDTPYTNAIDVWSVGVIVMEMLLGVAEHEGWFTVIHIKQKKRMHKITPRLIRRHILAALAATPPAGSFGAWLCPDASAPMHQLLDMLLQIHPDSRVSASWALEHADAFERLR